MQPVKDYKIDYFKVGQRIKRARIEHKLSQAELGEILGCSNNHVSHVEIGQTKPSLPFILKASYALQKSLDYFFFDTPYAKCETVIENDIAEKLQKCDVVTLNTIGKMIDSLLEYNKSYAQIQDSNKNNS